MSSEEGFIFNLTERVKLIKNYKTLKFDEFSQSS